MCFILWETDMAGGGANLSLKRKAVRRVGVFTSVHIYANVRKRTTSFVGVFTSILCDFSFCLGGL